MFGTFAIANGQFVENTAGRARHGQVAMRAIDLERARGPSSTAITASSCSRARATQADGLFFSLFAILLIGQLDHEEHEQGISAVG